MRAIEDNEMTPAQAMKAAAASANKPSGKLLDKTLLPSRGEFYPGDIYVTPFTGMDLKDLTTSSGLSINQLLYKILNKRVTGINTNDILISDKMWFLFYIRAMTYHDRPIALKCTCPHCGTTSVQQYTLDKLQIKYYTTKLPDKQLKMPNEDLIEFTFPTIGTESQIQRTKNDPNVIEAIDDQFMLLASYIKSINGRKLNLWEAYKYISNADAETFCFVVNKLDEFAFSCDMTAEFDCDCGEKMVVPIPLDQAFFIPKLF